MRNEKEKKNRENVRAGYKETRRKRWTESDMRVSYVLYYRRLKSRFIKLITRLHLSILISFFFFGKCRESSEKKKKKKWKQPAEVCGW